MPVASHAAALALTPASCGSRDVARVEMERAVNYNQSCTFDGMPSVSLSVYQLPTANALDTADRVKAKMAELKTRFPDGIDYMIATTSRLTSANRWPMWPLRCC